MSSPKDSSVIYPFFAATHKMFPTNTNTGVFGYPLYNHNKTLPKNTHDENNI
jgi:hypothetical protein